MKTPIEFKVSLPVAEDDLGIWMEEHGASVDFSCMLGTYHVTVTWGKLHSSSDDQGTHRETWHVNRYNKKLPVAIHNALTEAMRQTTNP